MRAVVGRMTPLARVLLLAALVVLAPAARADERSDQVDAIFAEFDTEESPGCMVAVVHDGEILYERGYGMADIENGVPITPETVFDIASASKQFTAMAILLLARDGALALDDDVRRHADEFTEEEE